MAKFNVKKSEEIKMNLLFLVILVFLGALIFWRSFRIWIVRQFRVIGAILAHYLPIIWEAAIGVIGIYARIVLGCTAVALVLIILALIINAPGFTAFAFVTALSVLILAWLPAGIILKIFRVNSAVIPKGLKVFVSWVAFLGFLGLLCPDVISFQSLSGFALLWLFLLGVTVKINVLDKIIFPLVVVMCLTFGWKYFFPDSFRSSTRYVSSWSKVSVTWKDRQSINHEAGSAVTYGYPVRDIQVAYIANIVNGKIIDLKDTSVHIARGTTIKIFNHKEEVKEFEGQGFIQIQLPRGSASFVKGKKCWIEADLIQLVTPNELARAEEQSRQFIADSIQQSHSRQIADSIIVASAYVMRRPGIYIIDVPVGGESQIWDSIPSGCSYTFLRGNAVKFSLIYYDGTVANSWEPGQWPNKGKFKVRNFNEERPQLVVNQAKLACR